MCTVKIKSEYFVNWIVIKVDIGSLKVSNELVCYKLIIN